MKTEEVAMPDGRRTPVEIMRHPGASAVVPFLSATEVLLIRQYRPAIGGFIYEVPAGKLDPGESPEACALRELEEETGKRAGRAEFMGSIWTAPGFTDERIHLFSAFDLAEGERNLDEDEWIELVPLPLKEALEMIWTDQLPDAKSALALIHAARRPQEQGRD